MAIGVICVSGVNRGAYSSCILQGAPALKRTPGYPDDSDQRNYVMNMIG
ncbi:hypothetical protein LL912_08315 [Niabella sp. CC-SYL272]|nr:hypothetical protein [Niabella agricola]MCF3108780.1 hypothetical protein [Niabella agricola]